MLLRGNLPYIKHIKHNQLKEVLIIPTSLYIILSVETGFWNLKIIIFD
jgi:hypothetical protein